MTDRPFFAIFPQHLKGDDEVIIKGKVKDDAKEFSINFSWDISPTPSYIAYHFKTMFEENLVVQNYKDKCMWGQQEEISENDWINGPGENFGLAFSFKHSEILIYAIEDEDSRNLIYTFRHQLDFEKIQTIQAWGDVEKITELTFRYS